MKIWSQIWHPRSTFSPTDAVCLISQDSTSSIAHKTGYQVRVTWLYYWDVTLWLSAYVQIDNAVVFFFFFSLDPGYVRLKERYKILVELNDKLIWEFRTDLNVRVLWCWSCPIDCNVPLYNWLHALEINQQSPIVSNAHTCTQTHAHKYKYKK